MWLSIEPSENYKACEVRNVTIFKGDKEILTEVSFDIKKGQQAALLGLRAVARRLYSKSLQALRSHCRGQ